MNTTSKLSLMACFAFLLVGCVVDDADIDSPDPIAEVGVDELAAAQHPCAIARDVCLLACEKAPNQSTCERYCDSDYKVCMSTHDPDGPGPEPGDGDEIPEADAP